jgi:hypothetical protein
VLSLPTTIEIHLEASLHERVLLGDLMVALRTFNKAQPYLDAILGLSDASGVLRVPSAVVVDSFRRNQQLFGMDFRIPLEMCDSEVEIEVPGGKDFAMMMDEAVATSFVDSAIKQLWRKARNDQVCQSVTRVSFDSGDSIRINIPVRAYHG